MTEHHETPGLYSINTTGRKGLAKGSHKDPHGMNLGYTFHIIMMYIETYLFTIWGQSIHFPNQMKKWEMIFFYIVHV